MIHICTSCTRRRSKFFPRDISTHLIHRPTTQTAPNPLFNWLEHLLKITSKRWQMMCSEQTGATQIWTYLMTPNENILHTSSHQWAGWSLLLNSYQYTARVQAKKSYMTAPSLKLSLASASVADEILILKSLCCKSLHGWKKKKKKQTVEEVLTQC